MSRTLIARVSAGVLLLWGCWVAYTQTQGKQPPPLTLNKVKDDLYEIEGDGGNVAVYLTSEGVILVDDKFDQDHENIVAKVKSVSDQPVKYVLSTHHHSDHSGGNAKFLPTAEIISTVNARANIVEHKQPNAPPGLAPARIVFTKECSVFLGGKEASAHYFGRGHTNGDAIIYFPALRTIHTGDLMAGSTPLIDYTGGGSVVEWTKTLDEALKLDFDTVIPGHGPVTTKDGLLAYRNNVEKLRNPRGRFDSRGQESGRRRQSHDGRVRVGSQRHADAVEPAGYDDGTEVTGARRGIPRRGLLRAAAAAAAIGPPAIASQANPSPAAAPWRGHLFADPSFDFTAWIELGSSYYSVGNPGKLVALTQGITDGNYESAFRAFDAAGSEARQWGEEAARNGHRVSAREAWLWAAKHYSTAIRFLDGTTDASRLLPAWRRYDECWAQAAGLFNPPVERVEIPYESTALTGWFFRVDQSRRPRPLMILNNGADGLEVSSYVLGVAGGLARGYHCLAFNGPGQGDSLWARKLYFRPDWERVITPVVDYALSRREVDRKRIALIGVSQGGYWVPRALAFEHRISAGVADPGVWNVADPWMRNLPPFLVAMLEKGEKEQFDATMAAGLKMNPKTKIILDFRMRPFGFASYYDAFRAVREYNLKDVAGEIRCPMLVTDPESEQFFPGQSRQLCEMLKSPKTLVAFTRDQGADLHCELNAPGYRDYRIYNWLDETLKA